MSAPNAPHVQVFHFTSRISSAKIRKYKLATERGMAGGSGREPTPSSANVRPSPSPSLGPPKQESTNTMEPPSKKPKLSLKVRPPSRQSNLRSQSPDTIAVSRPRRDSSLKTQRYSESMDVDHDSKSASLVGQKPSPAASSGSSSLSSVPSLEKEPIPAKEARPSSSNARDYSRDFMSYYVTGAEDDEDQEEEAPQPPQPAPRKQQEPPKRAPVAQQPPQLSQSTQFKHHTVPPPYPTTKAPPPRPAPPPMPQVNLIDTIKPAKGPREPDTVATMIKKLEHLSRTLTEFGGVPPVPKSPTLESQPKQDPPSKSLSQPVAEKKGGAVDNFLAMFDDDDSDEKDSVEVITTNDDSNLNYELPGTAEPDGPLQYGIQFIQNALRSWAYQRVTAQVAQQYQQMQMQARADSQPQKRGPGRPRKFDNGDEQSSFPQNPPVYQFDLANTPEGAAIMAFQEVLDSGCLQINTSLPVELSRALRHLYMQIDHLINQGSRSEPQWRCMSYGAQVTAHRIRVEKWKEQQARAQQEMARQQQLANMQVMQQMGLPPNVPRMPMTAEQAQKAHAIELERRRDLQHAAQQPHLTKNITHPMSFDSATSIPARPASATTITTTAKTGASTIANASVRTSASTTASPSVSATAKRPGNTSSSTIANSTAPASGSAPSSVNGAAAKSPASTSTVANSLPNTTTTPAPTSPADPANVHLDKIKLYMPNYLPRSGQLMKFSFAPNSELAVKAFGAQAFPNANNATSSIPNRGPMNIPATQSPTTAPNATRQTNGAAPVLDSNAPAPSPRSLDRSNSDTIEVAMKPSAHRESQSKTTNGKSGLTAKNGKRPPTQDSMMGSFNSVDISGPVAVSAASPTGASVLKSNDNSKASNLASRFPHPGAVVVDQ